MLLLQSSISSAPPGGAGLRACTDVESSLRARIEALAAEPPLTEAVAARAALIRLLDCAELTAPPLLLPADRVRARLGTETPLLDGEAVQVPPAAVALLERLAVATLGDPAARSPAEAILSALQTHRLHAEQLIAEALAGHADHLAELAADVGVPSDLLGSLADLAGRPLLAAYAACLRPALALGTWAAGWCPVCGALPVFGERRGDTARLRCGRCTTAWAWTLPGCPACRSGCLAGLDSLAAPGVGFWELAGCERCRAYLKVAGAPRHERLAELLVDDLATWRLDRQALERGLWRPTGLARRLELADLEGEELDDD